MHLASMQWKIQTPNLVASTIEISTIHISILYSGKFLQALIFVNPPQTRQEKISAILNFKTRSWPMTTPPIISHMYKPWNGDYSKTQRALWRRRDGKRLQCLSKCMGSCSWGRTGMSKGVSQFQRPIWSGGDERRNDRWSWNKFSWEQIFVSGRWVTKISCYTVTETTYLLVIHSKGRCIWKVCRGRYKHQIHLCKNRDINNTDYHNWDNSPSTDPQ